MTRHNVRVQHSKLEYLFKVNLKGKKRVWRTIIMRGDQTLEDLHGAIFTAFDRFEDHMYSFFFPHAPGRGVARSVRILEYTHPFCLEDSGPFDGRSKLNAAETRLDDLKLQAEQTFEYVFDFGDWWEHEVRAEDIRPVGTGSLFPRVEEKRGKSPSQYPDSEEN